MSDFANIFLWFILGGLGFITPFVVLFWFINLIADIFHHDRRN